MSKTHNDKRKGLTRQTKNGIEVLALLGELKELASNHSISLDKKKFSGKIKFEMTVKDGGIARSGAEFEIKI